MAQLEDEGGGHLTARLPHPLRSTTVCLVRQGPSPVVYIALAKAIAGAGEVRKMDLILTVETVHGNALAIGEKRVPAATSMVAV